MVFATDGESDGRTSIIAQGSLTVVLHGSQKFISSIKDPSSIRPPALFFRVYLQSVLFYMAASTPPQPRLFIWGRGWGWRRRVGGTSSPESQVTRLLFNLAVIWIWEQFENQPTIFSRQRLYSFYGCGPDHSFLLFIISQWNHQSFSNSVTSYWSATTKSINSTMPKFVKQGKGKRHASVYGIYMHPQASKSAFTYNQS